MSTTASTATDSYDRLTDLKNFDSSKLGVKGLLDSGLTSIPRIFHHPPETLPHPTPTKPDLTVPVIDLSGPRARVVDQVRQASSTLGFFQIVNHGVDVELIESLICSIKDFNEGTVEEKMRFYHRDMGKGAAFSTNFDLFQSKAASWRDTLQVRLGPQTPNWEAVPEICIEAIAKWDLEVVRLGEELMGMLCEGLGMESDRLKELSCLDGRLMVGHYYPYCPQPDLTVGITSHTDPGVLTVLIQNEVGNLQVKYGEDWVDVEPVPGAIIINIGDTLQILSNDMYKSVDHRVLANSSQTPRVSVAVFYRPGNIDNLYGPFPELVSAEKPAVFKQFILTDFIKRFFTKGLDGKSLINYYRV